MDVKKLYLPTLLLTWSLALPLFGQAMGHAAVDDPVSQAVSAATVAAVPATAPAAEAPAPAVTAAVPVTVPSGPLLPVATGKFPATPLTSLPSPETSATSATAPAAANPVEDAPIRKSDTAVSSTGSSSPTTTKSFMPSGLAGSGQVLAALVIVIGLVFVGKGLAKKYVPGAKTAGVKGAVEILSRHPLSKNQSLVLVRIGSQVVAINQGKDQSQSLLVISDPSEVARLIGHSETQKPRSISAGFDRLLANAAVDLRDERNDPDRVSLSERSAAGDIQEDSLEDQLEEMAAARRQLMDLRTQVRSVREKMPRS